MNVYRKRVYETPEEDDGVRVLVDRLWPRGLSKEDAALDECMKAITPSNELREWFDHDPDKWNEFSRRYREELREYAAEGRLTLLYAARDEDHNNARVLQEVIESQ